MKGLPSIATFLVLRVPETLRAGGWFHHGDSSPYPVSVPLSLTAKEQLPRSMMET